MNTANVARLSRPAFTAVDMYYQQFGETWSPNLSIGDDFKTRPWWQRELFLVQCQKAVQADEIVDAYGFLNALENVHLNAAVK